MAIEAVYYDRANDYCEVKREQVKVGDSFAEIKEGKTPEGKYVQSHVILINGDDRIFGYQGFQYEGRDRNEYAEQLSGEDINGSGWSLLTPNIMEPNIGVEIKYISSDSEEK